MFSAGNTRGLIEASENAILSASAIVFSAGNTRGLIEAPTGGVADRARDDVFRGEYPRPH